DIETHMAPQLAVGVQATAHAPCSGPELDAMVDRAGQGSGRRESASINAALPPPLEAPLANLPSLLIGMQACVVAHFLTRHSMPPPDGACELHRIVRASYVLLKITEQLFQVSSGLGPHAVGSVEQQAATSEILRIISSSPTDLQRIFKLIATS